MIIEVQLILSSNIEENTKYLNFYFIGIILLVYEPKLTNSY